MKGDYDNDPKYKILFEQSIQTYLDCLASLSVQGAKEGNTPDRDILETLGSSLAQAGYSLSALGLKAGIIPIIAGDKDSKSWFKGSDVAAEEIKSDIMDSIVLTVAILYENFESEDPEKPVTQQVVQSIQELYHLIEENPAILDEIIYAAVNSKYNLVKATGNQEAADFFGGYSMAYAGASILSLVGAKGLDKVLKIARGAKAIDEVGDVAIAGNRITRDVNGKTIGREYVNEQLVDIMPNSLYDWPELSGMLKDARAGKGNFGIGSGTHEQAQAMGKAWVGRGYSVASDGKTLVSADGLRQYRPPLKKNSSYATTRIQANFERREFPKGNWTHNGHLDITE